MSPTQPLNGFRAWALSLLTAILLGCGAFWTTGTVMAWTNDTEIAGIHISLQRIERKLDDALKR